MKQLYILTGLLFVFLFVSSTAAGDIQDDFLGITWGAAQSSVDNMQEVNRAADMGYYIRPGETFTINNINLGQPIYGFFQDKFFAAFIKIDSDKHIDEIKSYLDTEYGPVRAQLRVAQTIYIYDYHNIKIKLKAYETKGTYKLGFYYTPLSSKLNESRLEKNVETTIQLVPKK